MIEVWEPLQGLSFVVGSPKTKGTIGKFKSRVIYVSLLGITIIMKPT